MSNRVRVGVVGTGRMGSKRAADVVTFSNAEPTWICSREKDRAASLIDSLDQRHGRLLGYEAVDDWKAAVIRDDTDAVIFTTPNSHHAENILTAVEAGKHVFVEYPHAVSATEQEHVLAAVRGRENGRVVHVGLTHRFSSLHLLLEKRYFHSEGERRLGTPTAGQVTMCSGNPISRWYDDPVRSGGMFVSSMFHFLDEAMSLFGSPVDVWAGYQSETSESGSIESDCADVTLRFDQGQACHITYARGFPKPGLGSRSVYLFSGGYLVSDGNGLRELSPAGTRDVVAKDENAVERDTHMFLETCSRWASAGTERADFPGGIPKKSPGEPPSSDDTVKAAVETLRVALKAAEAADS
jgi:predicted dehydrogenase